MTQENFRKIIKLVRCELKTSHFKEILVKDNHLKEIKKNLFIKLIIFFKSKKRE